MSWLGLAWLWNEPIFAHQLWWRYGYCGKYGFSILQAQTHHRPKFWNEIVYGIICLLLMKFLRFPGHTQKERINKHIQKLDTSSRQLKKMWIRSSSDSIMKNNIRCCCLSKKKDENEIPRITLLNCSTVLPLFSLLSWKSKSLWILDNNGVQIILNVCTNRSLLADWPAVYMPGIPFPIIFRPFQSTL